MSDRQKIQRLGHQQALVRRRLWMLASVLAIMLGGLAARFYSLQIGQHEKFATLAHENRVQVRPVAPVRGRILDRNGVTLAENRPSYGLSVVPTQVRDMPALLVALDELLGLSAAELAQFAEQRRRPRRLHESIPLRFRLSEREVALLAVNEHRLPGIRVQVKLLRHYPFAAQFAHSVGYVGRIGTAEQARIAADRYQGTHVIGKSGIEKQYEDQLLGRPGYEFVEADAHGNRLRVLQRQDATPGSDIQLSIDSRLQREAHRLLAGRRAALVALRVATGEVLALVSVPSYDANLFVTGISHADYDALLAHPDRPLFDRALLGQYPPGSTIKPLFALAGLAGGVVDAATEIDDRGKFQLPGELRIYRDWKRDGHGRVNLHTAIEQSCDTYFYHLGHQGGIDLLSDYGRRFGLGVKTGLDMPAEEAGLMPTRAWKQTARQLPWFPGDTINAVIGQGFSLATPMQLAQMTANLARRGHSIRPALRLPPPGTAAVREQLVDLDPAHWDLVWGAMQAVVHARRGTAASLGRGMAYRMAGKTGTAQVVGIAQDGEYDSAQLTEFQRDHALFVSFAPAEAPQIAIAVIVENGEVAAALAAPVARRLTDIWLGHAPPNLNLEARGGL